MATVALSDYWRIRRSGDPALELAHLLENVSDLAASLTQGGVTSVRWGKGSHSSNLGRAAGASVQLDAGPLRGKPAPFDGESVDAVIGMMLHESGHIRWHSETVIDGARTIAKPSLVLDPLLHYLGNILEDYYLDRRYAHESLLAGQYIKASRDYYNKPKAAESHAARLDDPDTKPADRVRSVLQILASILLYGQPVPMLSDAPALEALCGLLDAAKSIGIKDTTGKRTAALATAWATFEGYGKGLSGPTPDPDDEDEDDEDEPAFGKTGKSSALEDALEREALDDAANAAAGKPSSHTTEDDVPLELDDSKQELGSDLQDAVVEYEKHHAEDLDEATREMLSLPREGRSGHGKGAPIMLDADRDPEQEAAIAAKAAEFSSRIGSLFSKYRSVGKRLSRGVTSGRISRSRLWKAGIGDATFFERKEQAEERGLSICLVLDNSGSIGGRQWSEILMPIAHAIVVGADKQHEVWCCSYTTAIEGNAPKIRVQARPEWGRTLRAGVDKQRDNSEGPALAAASVLLRKAIHKRRIVVLVTDGQPGAHRGLSGEEVVKRAVDDLHHQGIGCMTLLVGPYAPTAEAMQPYFGHCVHIKGMEDVPAALESLLESAMQGARF